MIVVLAEKPSVARDLAAVLGAVDRRNGWLEGAGYQVTWAVGHLVDFADPAGIRPEWKFWDAAHLPMLPEEFPLVPRDGVEEQLRVVDKLFNARTTNEIVCATDAGREGELIFRLIYEAIACRKPVKRLWISSLTKEAIAEGFRVLKPAHAYDALAAAARARSEADWLVGMNLSRAYTLASGDSFHVGRVKTPTLAMVVARDIEIARFVPHAYREVEARFAASAGEFVATYVRLDHDAKKKPVLNARLPGAGTPALPPELDAQQVVARALAGEPSIHSVEQTKTAAMPPQLFDLTELQRSANRLWGWTAQHTLVVAQELYEKRKALSYPRTDSRHLSRTVAAELNGVIAALRQQYGEIVAPGTGVSPLSKRFVDDAEVSDHHAIIPTAVAPALEPGSDAQRLYDLVSRRLLSAWHADAVDASTRVELRVRAPGGHEDQYEAKGKAVVVVGWRAVDVAVQRRDDSVDLPPGLCAGVPVRVTAARILEKQTKPPAHFTDAALLSAMESAGATLEKELSRAMKERGLGTPATRAAIIEELVAKGYLARDGKSLRAMPLGMALVRRVHPHVASPALTGEWEARLRRVERGELAASDLLKEVRKFVREVVQAALANGVAPRSPRPQSTVAPQPPDHGRAANRRKSGVRKQGSSRLRPRRGP